MAKKKALKKKRFYLSFELYTRGEKKRIPSVCTTFVPSTQRSLPDINDEEDDRDYGINDDDLNSEAFKKVAAAVQEFTAYLKTVGEID